MANIKRVCSDAKTQKVWLFPSDRFDRSGAPNQKACLKHFPFYSKRESELFAESFLSIWKLLGRDDQSSKFRFWILNAGNKRGEKIFNAIKYLRIRDP